MEEIVRLGDQTDHGGVVIQGFFETSLNGRPMAGKGHMVMCPRCYGMPYPIIEGSSTYKIKGVPVALNGMKTACGAKLMATGSMAKVE